MPTPLSHYASRITFFAILVFSLFFIGCPLPLPTPICTNCQTADLSKCPGLQDNMIEGQWIIRYSDTTAVLDTLISDLQVAVFMDETIDSAGVEIDVFDTIPMAIYLESFPVQWLADNTGRAILLGDQDTLIDDLNNHFFKLNGADRLVNGDVVPLKTCGCRMALMWINPQKVDLNNSVTQASSSTRTQDDGTPGKVTSVDINRKVTFGPGIADSQPRPIGLSCDQKFDKDKEQVDKILQPCIDAPIKLFPRDIMDTIGGITVAVIDSGLDYMHDAVNSRQVQNRTKSVVWVNSKEVDPAETGMNLSSANWSQIMFDQPYGNCYDDDFIGYDFLLNKGVPNDRQGHGTHVGGTIATAADIDPEVRIMPLKIAGYVGDSGQEEFTADLFSVLCAMDYAIDKNVAVINLSLGYYADAPNAQLRQLTERADSADILIVASVGNDNMNIDCCQHWPSNLSDTCSNVISVGALAALNTSLPLTLASYSNSGAMVNIAAPGTLIKGPDVGTGVGLVTKNGTSMAAAIISRQAILLRNQTGKPSAAATKQMLMTGKVGNSTGICVGNGLYYDFTEYTTIWPYIQYTQ